MTLSFLTLAVSFLLGGVTFIPLLLAVFLGFIFYTSPVVHLPRKTGIPHVDKASEEETEVVSIYRAGWLTVRRTYEPLVGPNDGTYLGAVVSGYRSFMDNRSRDPRRMKPKDKFYGVLKQSTLYLYDTEEQLECWAAIEVAAHDVIVYPEGALDGELFVKRNALCLRPKGLKEAAEEAHAAAEDKSHDMEPGRPLPWFIFASVNTDKEDWYHSFVQASKLGTPTTTARLAKDRSIFEPEDMARLVDGIDQQPDSIPMRWLNAMLGRIFLAVYRTETLEAYITSRIVRKLKRVKTPSILSEVQVREVNIGSAAPFFSKPMLKELTAEGDASMEVHVSYVGDMRITIETVATINLGSRFKPYSVRLVLAVVLKEIEGTLLFKIKKPPSNRLWFGFSSMPRMVLNVEPVVSTRQIKWSMITSPIEARIREVILESIVVPHMDDLSFFNSMPFDHRGGIWGDALRKEQDLSTPAGGSGDETTAIGHDDAVEDEIEADTTISTSTGREESSGGARIRPRRRRSSEGDSTKLSITSDDSKAFGKNGSPSSSSTLSGAFSLASWRDGRAKEKEASDKASIVSGSSEKRKSWFAAGRASTTSATPPLPGSTPQNRSSTVDDRPSTGAEGEELSAAKLRDILTKRARSRERAKEQELAAQSALEASDPTLSKKNSLSVLSLTAPSTAPLDPSVLPIDLSRADSAPPQLEPEAKTVYDSDVASVNLLSDSPMASVPDLTLEAASPVEGPSAPVQIPLSSRSASPSPSPSPAMSSSPGKRPPPPLPSRPSFTKGSTPPPRRSTHQATASADAGSMSFASAASTTSILASWRTKAADKQALAAGVAQAKDTMKRWGANWNARRAALAEEEGYDGQGPNSSPQQDLGRALPSSSSRPPSKSPPASPGREEYRDYRASKTRNGDYFGPSESSSSTSLSRPAPVAITDESKSKRQEDKGSDRDRKMSITNGSPGHFAPAAPQPTTKLTTATSFAPNSPPQPSTSHRSTSSISPPAPARTYGRASVMMIPGIRDENVKKAVASDHLSAQELIAKTTAASVGEEPKPELKSVVSASVDAEPELTTSPEATRASAPPSRQEPTTPLESIPTDNGSNSVHEPDEKPAVPTKKRPPPPPPSRAPAPSRLSASPPLPETSGLARRTPPPPPRTSVSPTFHQQQTADPASSDVPKEDQLLASDLVGDESEETDDAWGLDLGDEEANETKDV